MKKRLSKWVSFQLTRFVPSSRRICSLEAKRLGEFIVTNYDYNQHLIILEDMKKYLSEYAKNEIIKKSETINDSQLDIVRLNSNLDKLTK